MEHDLYIVKIVGPNGTVQHRIYTDLGVARRAASRIANAYTNPLQYTIYRVEYAEEIFD